ncbi:MAG: STAS domain-containing protein [Steroidobacteraceae bacterium]
MTKRSSTGRARKRASRAPAARAARSAARTRGRSIAGPAADATLHLPSECTLADVHELKSKLTALLKTESPVCVDVSGLRRIDTASLQLLAAFARDRCASRRAIDIRGESTVFSEAVRLLGLDRLFDPAAGAHPL